MIESFCYHSIQQIGEHTSTPRSWVQWKGWIYWSTGPPCLLWTIIAVRKMFASTQHFIQIFFHFIQIFSSFCHKTIFGQWENSEWQKSSSSTRAATKIARIFLCAKLVKVCWQCDASLVLVWAWWWLSGPRNGKINSLLEQEWPPKITKCRIYWNFFWDKIWH